jgi:signal transduction histidine kinase
VPHVTAAHRDFRHTAAVPQGSYNALVRGEQWLEWAAYATWLVVGTPTIMEISTGELGGWRAAVWVAAFLVFGALLTVCIRRSGTIALLTLQSLAGLTMVAVSGNGTTGATLVIVAAEAAAVLSTRAAWVWVAAQTVLLGVIRSYSNPWVEAWTVAGSFAGFQAFAIATMSLARSEREAREALARTNAELVATQSLLAENSRIAERLRISRDLHDTLGHHLTALSLQLDVASRLTSGTAADHVREAHAITRLLLGDVRSVVSQMRDSSRIDLSQSLRTLARGTGAVEVHLDVPDRLPVDAAEQAHALLQCVQEIITNAARHGGARHCWIRIERRADGIDLHARDDGRGAAELKWGNGLKGMRERFEEFSGRVEFTPGVGRGFEVHGFMPGAEAAS